MPTETDDEDFNKLLAELEKESEVSKPLLEKEIKKNKDEKKELNYEDPIDDETERTEENTW